MTEEFRRDKDKSALILNGNTAYNLKNSRKKIVINGEVHPKSSIYLRSRTPDLSSFR